MLDAASNLIRNLVGQGLSVLRVGHFFMVGPGGRHVNGVFERCTLLGAFVKAAWNWAKRPFAGYF